MTISGVRIDSASASACESGTIRFSTPYWVMIADDALRAGVIGIDQECQRRPGDQIES